MAQQQHVLSSESIDINETLAADQSLITSLLPPTLQSPKFGIVCGSGLAGLADHLTEKVLIPYKDLKGFGESTVSGHKSSLAFGFLGAGAGVGEEGKKGGVPVVAMLGRVCMMHGSVQRLPRL